MNANPNPGALMALQRALMQAVAAQDWRAVANTDQQVRAALTRLAQMPSLSPELKQARASLKQAYAEALLAWRAQCEALAASLAQHTEHAEARRAYLRTECLPGDY